MLMLTMARPALHRCRVVGQGYLSRSPAVVSAFAEVTEVQCSGGQDAFVVMASDGLWDVMSNDEVVRFVSEQIGADKEVRAVVGGG
jgi:serine/threonine protein phosphatase PrpC